jgi:hypothetical protein
VLLREYAALRATRPTDNVFVRNAAGRLIELYRHWGRPELAEPYRTPDTR